MRRKADVTKVCAFCGREFSAHNSTKKYCSDSCRVLAYRERIREKYGYIPESIGAIKQQERIQELTPAHLAVALGIGVVNDIISKGNPFKSTRKRKK